MIEIHNEQGTYSAKMGDDSFAENIIPKFIWLICPIGPKVWDIVEIRLHRASVVRAIEYRVRHYFNRYWIDQNLILSIF